MKVLLIIIAIHLIAIGIFWFVEMRLPDFNILHWRNFERALLLIYWFCFTVYGTAYTIVKYKKL